MSQLEKSEARFAGDHVPVRKSEARFAGDYVPVRKTRTRFITATNSTIKNESG
ncbi:hypothetical protein [Fundicoccus ignavus]|uniref:hypothetical protein n=1 Tax=Fundicoccus ignavus TaxID=2664442 RepID=UPI001562BA12|nr:hypothetical protein [Fundicoccus ignavus]